MNRQRAVAMFVLITCCLVGSPGYAGRTYLRGDGIDVAPATFPPAGAVAACLDNAYTRDPLPGGLYLPPPVGSEGNYYINTTGVPSGLATQFVARIVAALDSWNTAYNDCDIAGSSSLAFDYLGSTTATNGYTTYASDGINSINLTSDQGSCSSATTTCSRAGFAWRWYSGTGSSTVMTEWDITLNAYGNWYMGTGAAGIAGDQIDLQSIVTHEGGHVIGLLHVAGSDCAGGATQQAAQVHYYLTMYGCGYYGESFRRTLGWGDVEGLHAQA